MKLFNSLAAAFVLFAGVVQGQTLQVNQQQLNFGPVYENAPVTKQLTVTNNLGYPVSVTDIKFFRTYRDTVFAVDKTSFTLASGATQTLNITFSPKHNIAHNSEMVLVTDARGGHLSVDLLGQGKYSKNYYDQTENKEEEQLKQALKTTLSSPYTSLGYNTARDRMYMEIDNRKVNGQGAAVNTLECVYTGRVVTNYTSRTDLFNTYNINCEHTYPQGKFNSAEPMKSDIHHLFPTDEAANNSRNNYPFGVATQPYVNDNINNPSHLGSNGQYEPRDVHKGATARAMLYFVIRYQDYQNFFAPQEGILKEWNHRFAPTAADVQRNDDVQKFQKNRNPFVDYPQLADRITNFVSASVAPDEYALYQSPVVNYGAVPANTTTTFHHVLVNHGNKPVQISNPQLSNGALLSFTGNSGNGTTLEPGEAHTFLISLKTTGTDSVSETLTFNTNMPGSATVTVPVVANKTSIPTGVRPEAAPALKFSVYPNPASHELYVAWEANRPGGSYQMAVVNALGQLVMERTASTDLSVLDVSTLSKGVYVLRLQAGKQVVTRKFVKVQ